MNSDLHVAKVLSGPVQGEFPVAIGDADVSILQDQHLGSLGMTVSKKPQKEIKHKRGIP